MKNLREKITEEFLKLVAIDSPSGHEQEITRHICNIFKSMHIEHKVDEYGNIIAYISGKGEPLMLAAHMDTVEPGKNIAALIEGDLIKAKGDTILGADDKAGITEIMCAVEFLKINGCEHRPLEIVFTREEEIGLIGAQKLNRNYINAREGLVIDKSGPVQTVVVAAPFIMTIDIEIKGKAAHAGMPDGGINAIMIAAKAVAKLKVGRVDIETTTNIGIINGGEVRNGVPARVLLQAEVRSHVKEKVEKQTEKMRLVFEDFAMRAGGKVVFDQKLACSGYKLSLSDSFVKKIAAVWKEMGHEAMFEKAGGASDANEFAGWGMKIVDLGYGGINPHTSEEQIKISDMQLATEFIIKFVSS